MCMIWNGAYVSEMTQEEREKKQADNIESYFKAEQVKIK